MRKYRRIRNATLATMLAAVACTGLASTPAQGAGKARPQGGTLRTIVVESLPPSPHDWSYALFMGNLAAAPSKETVDRVVHCSTGPYCTIDLSSSTPQGQFIKGCNILVQGWSNGRTAWFVVGTDQALYVNYQDANWRWSGWKNFGGTIIGGLDGFESGNVDRPNVLALGTTGTNYDDYWNGSVWSGFKLYGNTEGFKQSRCVG